jgi:hypothetical membrane protein
MSENIRSAAVKTSDVASDRTLTRRLLACGVVAGPLFVVTGLIQAFTISGFDLRRHYLSQLSGGQLGWIQMANFIVTGLLFAASALGTWRLLRGSRMGIAGPAMIGAFGLCFAAAGLFVADPANGFPPGVAVPQQMSWHSIAHGIVAILAFLFLFVACLLLAYRAVRMRRWGWAAVTLAAGLISFFLPSVPNSSGGVFLFVAAAVGFAWVLALCVRLLTEEPGCSSV